MKNIKLKRKRLRSGFTQQMLADAINISLSAYCKKENGINKFTVDEAFKIAELLKCDIKDIF